MNRPYRDLKATRAKEAIRRGNYGFISCFGKMADHLSRYDEGSKLLASGLAINRRISCTAT